MAVGHDIASCAIYAPWSNYHVHISNLDLYTLTHNNMAYGDISVAELCAFSLRFVWFGVLATIEIVSYPFYSTNFTFKRTLWRRYVRTMCPDSSVRQLQWVLPPVNVAYPKFVKKQGLPVESEIIGEGARLHWFARQKSDYTMLFFHGGGYVMPAIDGHYNMIEYLRREAKKQFGKNMSIAMLEYTLANHTPWPQQGRQVAAALNHLLNQGIPPETIIIAGDSVGGHEGAFLLGHILNPHPNIQPIQPLKRPLAGAMLISPWVTFAEESPSYKLNAHTDLMPVPALRRWANLLRDTREPRDEEVGPFHFEPEKAEPEWWASLSKVVERVLITAGATEVMVDDTVSIGRKMQKGSGLGPEAIEIFVERKVGHNEPVAEFAVGDKPGETTKKMVSWLGDVLSK